MTEQNVKPAIASSGVWGGLIVVAIVLVRYFFQIEISENELAEIFTQAAAAFGGVLAIYGRWTAKSQIQGILSSNKVDRLL